MEKFDLRTVKEAQPHWFSLKNKRFFGDVSYRVLRGKKSGEAFLVRSTYAWSNMFGPKRLHYRINVINQETKKIGDLIDDTFTSIYAVKNYLKNK